MRILVTGADGFLGTSVVRRLRRSSGREVLPVTRRASAPAGSFSCDLGDPWAVSRLLRETEPDCIANLAARVEFGDGILPSLYAVNSLSPAILADYCHKRGAYLVQASTIVVHAVCNTRFGKDTPEQPDSDYGRSKLLAERAIIASGCSCAIIRFSGLFGVNGPEHLGINRAIQQAIGGTAPDVVGNGSARRNYLFVEDAAAMIDKCVTDRLQGVFFAGGETRSIIGMLEAICGEWLPGQVPTHVAGLESHDQLMDVNPELGPSQSFRDSLRHCR